MSVEEASDIMSCVCVEKRENESVYACVRVSHPTNIDTTRATPTATSLVVISDGAQNLGCYRLLQGYPWSLL